MKKVLIIVMSTLFVISTLVTGVFALYTTNIEPANGAVVAKNFVLTGAETDSFENNAKIAPTETLTETFTIANFEGDKVTEVNMNVTIDVTLTSTIAPLTIQVYEIEGETRTALFDAMTAGTTQATTTFTANTAETKTYEVVINWPSTANDIAYENGNANYTVAVTGTQVA